MGNPAPGQPEALDRWSTALARLLEDRADALRMAACGRDRVTATYAKQANLQALLQACGA